MSSGEQFPNSPELSRRGFLTAVALSGTAAVLEACSSGEPKPELKFAKHPDWEQDFTKMPEGAALDPFAWNFDIGNAHGWGNDQLQTYTNHSKNVRLQHGRLILQANRELGDGKPPYTSARINTHHRRSFGYGKLEVSARLPVGTGTWPGVWMLAESPRYTADTFGIDPKDPGLWGLNGEIDIMEAVGARPGLIYPNLHTYNSVHNKLSPNPDRVKHVPDDTAKFHTYGVERSPDTIIFTFDSKPYYQVNKADVVPKDAGAKAPLYWPFDQPYYLLLNLAMGGDWGGEDKKQFPPNGIDDTTGPWQLQFQSVRHYPLIAA